MAGRFRGFPDILSAVFVYRNMPDKDVLVCMEICKGLRYNSDVGNKQDILICKEEAFPREKLFYLLQ